MAAGSIPPFAALRAFDMIGQKGGIRKAALALGISHTIVGRHLAALEEHVGLQLFNRKTGELTSPGEAYQKRIRKALVELEDATAAAMNQSRNSLAIWCSDGFSLSWLALRIPEFSRQMGRDAHLINLRSADTEPSFADKEADGDIRYFLDAHV